MTTSRPTETFALLTPSVLSGLVAVLSMLAVISAGLFTGHKQNTLQEGLSALRIISSPTIGHIGDRLSQNSLLSNLPLFLFWLVAGIVVYVVASRVIDSILHTLELRKELDYVNVRRKSLMTHILVEHSLQTIAFIGWVVYSVFFLRVLLPYALLIANQFVDTRNIASLLSVSGTLLLATHLHVILLRLTFLRVRLFSS